MRTISWGGVIMSIMRTRFVEVNFTNTAISSNCTGLTTAVCHYAPSSIITISECIISCTPNHISCNSLCYPTLRNKSSASYQANGNQRRSRTLSLLHLLRRQLRQLHRFARFGMEYLHFKRLLQILRHYGRGHQRQNQPS